MCVGAMVHARIGTVVFGAPEPKAGALVSTLAAHELPSLNHRMAAVGGVLPRDVILAVNRQDVSSISQITREIQRIASGEVIPLLVWRNGQESFLLVTKP